MAQLKIYNEIVDEETKVNYRDWLGTDGVCYKDITDFLEKMEEGDNNIELLIHCPGGNCLEGWAIYDKLRQSGKQISATIEGNCSSMATIILLAAPKERRYAYENARMCIHNPAVELVDVYSSERLTADEIAKMKGKLTAQESSLLEEQNRILDVYVERTGADRGELQAIMNEDKFIDMDKAKELGFITDTIAPNTASKKPNKYHNKMAKEKITIENKLVKRLLALAGVAKIEDVTVPLDQKITAADGTEFTVEREDGDPQVGDKAYPNGTYTLDDGTIIVVEDELISSITPADNGGENGGGENNDDKDEQISALQAKVDELTATNETLQSENESLRTENDSLKSEKEDLIKSQKTDEETSILDVVAKAGGKAWLETVCNLASTYHAGNRQFVAHGDGGNNKGLSKTQQMLANKKAEQEAKRNARK